jgi:hypothetical protein
MEGLGQVDLCMLGLRFLWSKGSSGSLSHKLRTQAKVEVQV